MRRVDRDVRFWALALAIVLAAGAIAVAGESSLTTRPFGKTADGASVDLYTLTNSRGMQATITNYGGIVVTLKVPDRNGNLGDVVLGYGTLDEYVAGSPYFGAIVGRYGNRIGKGTFSLDGKPYVLAQNNNENHLHGGIKGFDKLVWEARGVKDDQMAALRLHRLSPDGEEGYPGNLSVTLTYTIPADKNELRIHYHATTDKPTVINLTNHSYFNLAGQGRGDILGHRLMISADRFTPVDEGLIPTGELCPVAGTPMDFTEPKPIGERIDADDEQLKFGLGYDHNWVLNKSQDDIRLAARVYEPTSGRVMTVFTTEPGIQFYSGNFLDGSNVGKGGKVYRHRFGFCLETQHFPDSPNKPDFPSTLLKPGEEYATVTVYKFSTQ